MSVPVLIAILAAGNSARMGQNKLGLRFGGKSVLELTLDAFNNSGCGDCPCVIAASGDTLALAKSLAKSRSNTFVVQGGACRGESAHIALKKLYEFFIDNGNTSTDYIALIHDAARCLVDKAVINNAITCAKEHGSGIAAVPVRDTLRYGNGKGVLRDGLYAMQTPQCFRFVDILGAYEKNAALGYPDTDDCAVYMRAGFTPHYSSGSLMNQKITYPEDKAFFNAAKAGNMRIGYGEDTHVFAKERKLILGGVEIPYEVGLLGHSDADVLAHAITDAILGAAALGDIGRHFPDNDDKYKSICSLELLKQANALLNARGFAVNNIDSTIVAQRPKLAPYIKEMENNIAMTLGINADNVSIKATTTEGMNAEGQGLCISAKAVCTII